MDTIKKVFVLAGGNDQIELIKGLRARFPRVEVILIDMNPDVRAREYADRMLVLSTMDFEKVLEAAKEEKIDLILSACGDQPLRTMAYVSEKLGLPCYLTYEQSQNLTNKVLMKKLMIEGNIPTAKYKRFNINSGITSEGLDFPLVIKPADNNGSKGIIKVYSEEEFENAINEARRYTLNGNLLVEEFQEGEEYSIEAFLKDGEPIIIFSSKNIKIKNRNTFTICKNEYVGDLNQELESEINSIIKQIGKVFGIDNVPLLIQLIVKDDKAKVIEFSARTGGGSKLFFIRDMSNVDVIDNLIDITIGMRPNFQIKKSDDSAAILYAYVKPGVFSSIENLDSLQKEGLISRVFLYKPYGTEIKTSNYSSDRPAGFLVRGKSAEDLKNKIRQVNERVKILNQEGEDILLHEFLY